MDSAEKKDNFRKERIPMDKGRYEHLIGKLIYGPDIAYSISGVSQYMNNQLKDNLNDVN